MTKNEDTPPMDPELKSNIKRAVELLGVRKVVEAVGIEEVVEEAGIEKK